MLRFRLLGIPVGVHLTFLFVALLGATAYRGIGIVMWTMGTATPTCSVKSTFVATGTHPAMTMVTTNQCIPGTTAT